jgi:hypothetical protein
MATESSVIMALAELQKIEEERSEAKRREEAAAERAEAQRRREMEEQAARAESERRAAVERDRIRAEAEARLRVDAEVARDRSLEDLRARIAAVQAEREALKSELHDRIEAHQRPQQSRWALAFGMSSLVAAALAGVLVVQAQRPAPVLVVPTATDGAASLAAGEPEPEPEAIAAPEPVVEVATPEPAPRPRRRVRPDHRVTPPATTTDPGQGTLDHDLFGGDDDDPIGGVEHEGTSRVRSGARRP